MGQQQIILIVLTAILVAIALTVGITMFKAQALAAHQDLILTTMNTIFTEALVHKHRPLSQGGGGGSFLGFVPVGADTDRSMIGNQETSPNTGFRLERDEAVYYVELWPNGSYKQRVAITASSKVYGDRTGRLHAHGGSTARMIVDFDEYGQIGSARRPAIEIVGNWP